MNALAANAQPTPAPAQATPLLRTLLLTDLVDSTGTVERLGDAPSAELFRAHDRLVLELQQRWRGRLIDRSDGLLLMFERAIDGLGFALDYHRGLRELGKAHGVPLQARAGLHVGEVLTWRNSAEAVAVGAKPLEVEGLAKPLAGRLLGLARPGQILLSATAEALAHRAARELGERGAQLAWKSHGRWRFKGVPEPLEVYEAGEPGLAPLQAPRPDAKAWRDIPFWRRPAALAAELALVAVVAIGIWFFTRPQPAIAFSERDWVVVADMRNLTGQPVLDESLQQAFRISLEQSRHVNVLSDLKARDTLARMQRPPGTALDREIASEIAVRDGARAVILPTVAEVGGRVRVSAEVIDPQSQTTVYAEYADGSGLDSVLASVDAVTAALRGRLGEEIKAIERDSEPLPQVTTSNLDALRAYALGVQAQVESKSALALQHYKRAIELDPQFALAYLAVARVHAANDDPKETHAFVLAAQEHRDHLPPRDRLYADAWLATFGPVEPMLEKWQLLSSSYPDYFAGDYNYAYFAYAHANEYSVNMDAATRAMSEKNRLRGAAYHMRATLHVGNGDYAAADRDFEGARRLGMTGIGFIEASSFAARRRFGEADKVLASVGETAVLDDNTSHHLLQIAMPLDQADVDRARANAASAVKDAAKKDPLDERVFSFIDISLRALATNEASSGQLAEFLDEELALLAESDRPDSPHAAFSALATGYLAARTGMGDLATKAMGASSRARELGYPTVDGIAIVLEAERLRQKGEYSRAIELLLADKANLYQRHVVLMRVYADSNQPGKVLEEAEWLRRHRARAYIEYGSYYILQSMNILDSHAAELYAAKALLALGRKPEAAEALSRFDRLWSDEPPAYLRGLRKELADL